MKTTLCCALRGCARQCISAGPNLCSGSPARAAVHSNSDPGDAGIWPAASGRPAGRKGAGRLPGVRGALRAAQGQRTRHSRAPSLRAAVRRRAAKTGASSSRSALRALAVPGSLRTTTERWIRFDLGEPSVAVAPGRPRVSHQPALAARGRTMRPQSPSAPASAVINRIDRAPEEARQRSVSHNPYGRQQTA